MEKTTKVADAVQWSVTFSRQKTKKNKAFQDGSLLLRQASSHNWKATLIDDGGKVLEEKLLSTGKGIHCGGNFEFDGFIVEIGDTIEQEDNLVERDIDSKLVQKGGVNTKLQARDQNLVSSTRPGKVAAMNSNMEKLEWNAIYTRQKTQKSKKFHDGALVISCNNGSHWQAILYDDSQKLLEKCFLKDVTDIQTGGSLEFQNYLIEVGELKTKLSSSSVVRNNSKVNSTALCSPVQLTLSANNKANHADMLLIQNPEVYPSDLRIADDGVYIGKIAMRKFHNPAPRHVSSSEKVNICKRFPEEQDLAAGSNIVLTSETEPVKFASRDVNQILKILKKPLRNEGANICSVQLNPVTEGTEFSSVEVDEPVKGQPSSCAEENLDPSLKPIIINGQDDIPKSSLQTSTMETPSNEDTLAQHTKTVSSRRFLAPNINRSQTFQSPLQHTLGIVGDSEGLVFQPQSSKMKFRQVTIPNEFDSLQSYKDTMIAAITEELNLILQDLASSFHEAMKKASKTGSKRPKCSHGFGELRVVKKDGANKGRLFYSCPSQIDSCLFSWADNNNCNVKIGQMSEELLQQALTCYGFQFFTNCELLSRNGSHIRGASTHPEIRRPFGEKIQAGGNGGLYLKLGKVIKSIKFAREKCILCGKEFAIQWESARLLSLPINRIWESLERGSVDHKLKFKLHKFKEETILILSEIYISASSDDFVVIAASEFHGPSSSGFLELRTFAEKPCMETRRKVYALHGPCVRSEFTMLDTIRNLDSKNMPLLPVILKMAKEPPQHSLDCEAGKLAFDYVTKFKLNSDQAEVIQSISKWFSPSINAELRSVIHNPDICLVHGTFGSGKSYLLVIIVLFLTTVLEMQNDRSTRILISAATNVAVDRVLTGLLEQGFTDFIRIGNRSKIASCIRPYFIHTSADTEPEEDILFKGTDLCFEDSHTLKRKRPEEEWENMKESSSGLHKDMLGEVRVVGVTCFSCMNEILNGCSFKICLLDECSQIPEPLSLIPLSQFGCEKLVAVGDPAQLPPVLYRGADSEAYPENKECAAGISSDAAKETLAWSKSDLGRALFLRLVNMGQRPILLRTQYRCHPRIVEIPNKLFYKDKLLNGCSEGDRNPMVESLPPLLFCDTGSEGSQMKDLQNSYFNAHEASLVCHFIKAMIMESIPGSQIGVIVFYKSQAELVNEMLAQMHLNQAAIRTKQHKYTKQGKANNCEWVLKQEERHDTCLGIQVSTVDAFQGMEKNIIILSCCRTDGVGFLASPNRLNVALTRARHHLVVIGKGSNLRTNGYWRKLLEYSRNLECYVSASKALPKYFPSIDLCCNVFDCGCYSLDSLIAARVKGGYGKDSNACKEKRGIATKDSGESVKEPSQSGKTRALFKNMIYAKSGKIESSVTKESRFSYESQRKGGVIEAMEKNGKFQPSPNLTDQKSSLQMLNCVDLDCIGLEPDSYVTESKEEKESINIEFHSYNSDIDKFSPSFSLGL